MRDRRAAIPADDRAAAAEAVAERLAALPVWQAARTVTLTASLADELDTTPILAMAAGKRVGLPVTPTRGLPLSFREPVDPLVPGPFGVLEPSEDAPEVPLAEVDVIVMPLLAVDPGGRRLGYGGGYYDRTVALAPRALRLAACFDAQVLDEVPAGDHDARVDVIVTEHRVLWTGARP